MKNYQEKKRHACGVWFIYQTELFPLRERALWVGKNELSPTANGSLSCWFPVESSAMCLFLSYKDSFMLLISLILANHTQVIDGWAHSDKTFLLPFSWLPAKEHQLSKNLTLGFCHSLNPGGDRMGEVVKICILMRWPGDPPAFVFVVWVLLKWHSWCSPVIRKSPESTSCFSICLVRTDGKNIYIYLI